MNPIKTLLYPLVVSILAAAAPALGGENPARPSPASITRADGATRVDRAASVDKGDKGERASSKKPALRGTANLNTADSATLELLPGIGEKKAASIIAFRHNRQFKKVEDLTRVKGFGRKTLQKLKPFLSVAGPNTLGLDEEGGE